MLITLPFGRLLEDIFHPSALFYSVILCRLKALSTNQKDRTVSVCFFFLLVPFLLVNMAPAFYSENLPSCVTQDVKEQRVKDGIRLVHSLPGNRASHKCDQQY